MAPGRTGSPVITAGSQDRMQGSTFRTFRPSLLREDLPITGHAVLFPGAPRCPGPSRRGHTNLEEPSRVIDAGDALEHADVEGENGPSWGKSSLCKFPAGGASSGSSLDSYVETVRDG